MVRCVDGEDSDEESTDKESDDQEDSETDNESDEEAMPQSQGAGSGSSKRLVPPPAARVEHDEQWRSGGDTIVDKEGGLKARDLIGRRVVRAFSGQRMEGTVEEYVVGRKLKGGNPSIVYWVHWETDDSWMKHGSGAILKILCCVD